MNRKLIFHLCILAALVCLAAIVWIGLGDPVSDPTAEEWARAEAEDRVYEDQISGERRIEGWKPPGISQGGKLMLGIAMLVLVAGYGAIVFVTHLLPAVVNRFTHLFYGSDEQVEMDTMHDARALFAQGDFEGAIAAYREVADEQPENRFPWVEISKIQHDNLENPDAAISTLRLALESHEWRVHDAAFFMFRLADMYEGDKEDLVTSISILQQVVELFPETRHSANAIHRLRELDAL